MTTFSPIEFQVREQAVKNVSSLSTSVEFLPFFKLENSKAVKQLAELLLDTPIIAHTALSTLINLSADETVVSTLDTPQFIYHIVLSLVLPKSVLADLYCMLLNNLSKSPTIREKLIPTPTLIQANEPIRTQHLDNLIELFVRGESKAHNPHATYDFLAGVFANIAATAPKVFLDKSGVDNVVRLNKLALFTDHQKHKSLIRRDGVTSVIKNCCFDVTLHVELLGEGMEVLVAILLPLMGNEDYDDDDIDGMPSDLQLLESTKTRETDIKIRRLHLESLLLLSSSYHGRTLLRARKVYPIVQRLHLVEVDDIARELIEKIVDLLMRDESEETLVSDKKLQTRKVEKSLGGIAKSDGSEINNEKSKKVIDKDYSIEEVDTDEDEDLKIEPLDL
ncbi:hypothetical protein HK096_008293 [Nowakowskiella sp. JEL0078]|nr:hypothetical protein HK096_008293 [Nowakowskiella sp. JEL0078]